MASIQDIELQLQQFQQQQQLVLEAIDDSFFIELLEPMKERCQAVFDANGMHT